MVAPVRFRSAKGHASRWVIFIALNRLFRQTLTGKVF